ncbi:lysophospholipase [Sphingomonas panacisoli]|uniref:Lysophospholipase n=1 Tax=Sphingomonas panacisoli TaxID=1813879 RepID=A0A5B8LHT5_9SPHN|nr:alpha/beta hydrolase [Sphingomonas panacisoli]QDZ07867.1 lysophospholipase [Sphingomonas panacisoli]
MTDPIIAQEQWLDGAAGRLFVRHWPAEGQPAASLVICHGFNAHSGHYARAAEVFAQRGIAITALDLRGRGRSDGERFYVESIDDYVADLSQAIDLARSLHPQLPVYLLGHSAGGVTAVTYALDHADRIAGLISESFAFRVFAPDVALALLKGASHIVPHVHAVRLKMSDFSRDPAWVAHLEADPLVKDEVQPIQTMAALARADERLAREFGRITLPVLILHGTADHATKSEGSQAFLDAAGSSDKTLNLYKGFYHDLLNDVDRDRVSNDIGNWIAGRV